MVLSYNQSSTTIYLTLSSSLPSSSSRLSSSLLSLSPLLPSSPLSPCPSYLPPSPASWSTLPCALEFLLAAALAAALTAISSLYKSSMLGLTPYSKAFSFGCPYQDFKHSFALIISALRQLWESVIKCFAELNTLSHLILISGIANISRANRVSSGCKKYCKF